MQREIRIVLERSNPLLTSLDARVTLLKVEEEKKILYIGELHKSLQTVTSVFVCENYAMLTSTIYTFSMVIRLSYSKQWRIPSVDIVMKSEIENFTN